MNSLPRLSDYLPTLADRFQTRKKWLIFSELIYAPSGEKVIEGFRYFTCPIGDLVAAFNAGNIPAITALPYALDEDGDPDTSSVLLDLATTASGAFVALQPVEYQDHSPTAVAPTLLIEGDAARAVFSLVQGLDQSS